MTQTTVISTRTAAPEGKPPAWDGEALMELGAGYGFSAAHDRDMLYFRIKGAGAGEQVEIVLQPAGRGEWAFWVDNAGNADVKLPAGSRIVPRLACTRLNDEIHLAVNHLDTAPENFLASTPKDAEEWAIAVRIYPAEAAVTPLAWLEDGSLLRFAGGRKYSPVALKQGKPPATGMGLVLIRLDFPSGIPEGTEVTVEPKDRFIPVKSKDMSYVKGRVAKAGTYRVLVEIPAVKPETAMEDEDTAAEEGTEEQGEPAA
ncbi:MAG TPA: hypothetical protein ENN09_06875, partial [Planctomycetes bacterium]|nr:hypothetical protein [Planctomycetota bacterium]